MAHNPIEVWKTMDMKIWPERYWLIDVAKEHHNAVMAVLEHSIGKYHCVIRDQTGYSLIVDDVTWKTHGSPQAERQKFGPLKVISTDGPLPFDVTGFIKAALEPVNSLGMKAAPQCGAAADHFFCAESEIEKVAAVFEQFTAGFATSQ
ncbi:hypothetical protein QP575_11080 [Alcaligenes faecalis subsp. phenolicus]|uniref:hypothetical protein n=1 Tax=Alcaligenes nematophilus TaxID=2994643 RepID=UPI002AA46B69|nr:hypothetical protein [Alcaligenes phenolicus]